MIARIWVLAALAVACEAVPAVTYAEGDASVDGASDAESTCPSAVPAFATSCCGPIPCFGAACTAACSDCVSRCTLAELCCPNAQARATCKAQNQTCP